MNATPHELPAWECFELLASTTFGRLCVVDEGYPIAIPISYRVIAESGGTPQLVMRTAPETIIGRVTGPCSLEADDIDLERGRAWSVIARGTLHPVLGNHGLVDPKPLIEYNRTRWMTLDIAVVSGRRFLVDLVDDVCTVDWQIV